MYDTVAHCAVVNLMTLFFCNADDLEDMLRAEEKKKHGRKWVKRARELMKFRDENGGDAMCRRVIHRLDGGCAVSGNVLKSQKCQQKG